MKITITKNPLALEELREVLKQQFSSQYSCELFTLSDSVFVSKSRFAAVQVSTSGQEITLLCSTKPSALVFLSFLFGSGTLELFYRPQRRKMLREIAIFLKEKYS